MQKKQRKPKASSLKETFTPYPPKALYMMQVRPSPPSPPQWLVAPQACCFALFPSARPVVWCGLVWLCPRCLALFPSPPPCGVVVVPAARPLISSSSYDDDDDDHHHHHQWLVPPQTRCIAGFSAPPPPPVVWCGWPPPAPPCGVVWLCPRPGPTAAMSIPSGGKSPLSQGSAVFDS